MIYKIARRNPNLCRFCGICEGCCPCPTEPGSEDCIALLTHVGLVSSCGHGGGYCPDIRRRRLRPTIY